MGGEDKWLLGRYSRGRDATASVEVVAERDPDGTCHVIDNPQRLFPKNGEVELRGIAALILKPGDWILFHAGRNDRSGGTAYKVTTHRRLTHYQDLAAIGSAEAIRRLLVEDGLINIASGEWTFRIDEITAVTIAMAKGADGHYRAVRQGLARLPITAFNTSGLLSISGAEVGLLYDAGSAPCQLGTVNWAPDAEYIDSIIQSFDDVDHTVLVDIVGWLQRHEDRITKRVSSIGNVNIGTAWDVLRVRALATRLAGEREVIRAYLDAAKSDPDVKALLERAAAEFAEAERESVVAAMRDEVREEVERGREELLAEAERTVSGLESLMLADLDAKMRHREEEAEARVTEHERASMDAINCGVAAQKHAIEAEVSHLEVQRRTIMEDIKELTIKQDAVRATLSDLGRAEVAALERLERLFVLSETIQGQEAAIPASEPQLPVAFFCPSRAGAWFNPAGLRAIISGCKLLNVQSKSIMMKFVALMLAGEVPILYGEGVEDFLEIAQAIVSSGRLARLDVDPTFISFDDLWIRPGTRTATQLREAAIMASIEKPVTMIGVVAHADRSGARFWYPTLATKARRGELARRLLLCTTVDDLGSEEAKAMMVGACALKVPFVCAEGAAVAAPIALGTGPKSLCHELVPSDAPADYASVVGILSAVAGQVPMGVVAAKRLARIVAEAQAFMEGAEIETFAREAAGMIIGAITEAKDSSSQALKVVKGGVTNA